MAEVNVYLYEGMFLFNPAAINSSVGQATKILEDILRRAEAEVISIARWDDRKLAYPIQGQKRGLYLLTHFRARGTQIPNIERDVNLSEQVMRCLILRAEHMGETELESARQAHAQTLDHIKLEGEKPAAPAPAAAGAPAASASATAVEDRGGEAGD